MSSPNQIGPEAGARSLTGGRWTIKEADQAAVQGLMATLGLTRLTAHALFHRGLSEAAEARRFLEHDLGGVHDPFLMRDMDLAVDRIAAALEQQALIRIHGDYDVDGVCATALMVRALRGLGGNVDWYIPHRVDEGYGVNEEAIRKADADGVGLLITVDCGSTAVAPMALARELGLEVVITDHHRPGPELPEAATLDPWRADCGYPFKHLAGVGVAFKLVTALGRRRGVHEGHEYRFLDLVCLGTVADVVPLLGENRLFVQHGLRQLPGSRKTGLAALLEVSELEGEIGSRQVAFVLAPRINAVGRMEHARDAVNLLLTADMEEARRLAAQLSQQNARRREEEHVTLEEAERLVQEQVDLSREKVMVLAREGWHPGVIGIVASRLVERYHRPTLLITVGDGVGKGSGRSIAAFNLWEALCECAPLLTRFGGHHYAAGFGVKAEDIAGLRERINAVAETRLRAADLVPSLAADVEADLEELTVEAVRELGRLAPFGMGNPPPMLVSRNLRVVEAQPVGSGAHLSLRLADRVGRTLGAIWFGRGELRETVQAAPCVEVCYRPQMDEWNGNLRVRLFVEDMRRGDG